jgi:hygromycin-B 7''-O-kinase
MSTKRASFPAIRSREEYDALERNDPLFLQLAILICEPLGVSSLGIKRASVGTSICFQVGEKFVRKLFAPIFKQNFDIECAVLSYLVGKLPTAVPELVARGSMGSWHYLLMTYLGETPLADAWNRVSEAEKVQVCEELGTVLAALHGHTDQSWFPFPTDWNAFLATRASDAAKRHRRLGLGGMWVERAEEFLRGLDLRAVNKPSLIHTEIMREHIIVSNVNGYAHISGLIDFEAAMFGHPEFEFSWVGVQLTRGNRQLFSAVLDGYGLPQVARDTNFRKRLMAYTLLHPYSVMKWYFDWMPVPTGVDSFEELAELWWAA